ncbi:MAG: hypothetical protein A2174_01755 [Candidatus Portnoybacteria bacterium RBG_13_41_18]|uniref:ABC transporter substrate-binding protein n=1 Tax=Candidatus Portnoybacteria bacterium RBG_13_41_18 TaxID=1801991 RepID=A0A1G2F8K7_9BACT|nr:MAG: hypothetical protein A2174_01755 [Candidatus Portnoybacteria bacterium RBG_13_41_18]
MNFFKKNKKTIVLNFIAPLMIFGMLGSLSASIFSGCGKQDPKDLKATLEFWNVFDNSDVYFGLIQQFNKEYPNIKITYYKKDYIDYEKDLVNDMAAGRGPQIFGVHNTWLSKHADKIYPMPPITQFEGQESLTPKEFKDTFVDVVAQDFIVYGQDDSGNIASEQIDALPLYVDTLALYWNKDLFNSAGISGPPKDWLEFSQDVEKLTKRDESNNILQAGAALGTATNINRAQDILALLMMQTGTEMVDLNSWEAIFDKPVKDAEGQNYASGLKAFEFYYNFANTIKKTYTWNNQMDYSIDAFAKGNLAMMINYSYHITTIKAKQTHLNFAIAAVPQPENAKINISYPNYWGLTVSSRTTADQRSAAWIFIKWLTQSAQAKQYLELVHKPTARRDLVDFQKNDQELGVFAQQSLTARSWYQIDNVAIDEIFNQMIDTVSRGQATLEQALQKGAKDVTVIMKKKAEN